VLAAGALTALHATGPIPWGRVAFGYTVYLVVQISTLQLAQSTGSEIYFMMVPARLLGVTAVFYRPTSKTSMLVASGLIMFASATLVGSFTIGRVFLGDMVETVLIWPLVQTLRHDLAVPSDGLWWRCLLLLPSWTAITIAGVPITLGSSLSIPIAAWIGSRHGTRALPAIALALAPMAFGYNGRFGRVNLSLGGLFDFALAALLLARFVTDRSFRERTLLADRLDFWQASILVVLPLGYASPGYHGFYFSPNTGFLTLVLAALIGLSRVPLRRPVLIVGLGSFAVGILIGILDPILGIRFGYFLYGLDSVPGYTLAIIVTLCLFRVLRAGPDAIAADIPAMRALLAVLDRNPLRFALLIAPIGYLVYVEVHLPRPFHGTHISFNPLTPVTYVLLTLYWAARRVEPRTFVTIGLARGSIPWSVLTLAGVAALGLAPEVVLRVGWLSISLFGESWFGPIDIVLSAYAFARLGAALPPLLLSPPYVKDRKVPAFGQLPVRLAMAQSAWAMATMMTLGLIRTIRILAIGL
jgi:hypothetical protein